MLKDSEITEMIFRVDTTKDFKGTIFAVFPYDVSDTSGRITTYQHVGQHSSGDYQTCLNTSRPANELESIELKTELEQRGYNIKIVKKRNYSRYYENYKKLRQIYSTRMY